MSYVTLYRKYRSRTFEEVMGQEHITRTLQNAIRLGKIAHAYLFCGTRGTGKTTTARLLAKALNCEKGPTPEPCNECPACRSINGGSAIDLVELDAASHRGVQDVARIRENVKFPPMALRYKVFIIDEAHQLSPDAKDAFLKTLEEPPAHTIFILATTEPHNIPMTIRSRCQQFDFRRGSPADIRSRLKFVADGEEIEAADEALELIAMNADGSWRDALSLLEQVLAYTDGRITVDDVYTVLGTVTRDFLFQLGDMVAAGDESGAFAAADEAAESGKELRLIMRSLAEHFRNLLFVSVMKSPDAHMFSEETSARLREQAAKYRRPALLQIVEIFSKAEQEARYSDQHKLVLELAILKAIEAANPEEPSRTARETSAPQREKRPVPERAAEPVSKPAPAAAASTPPPGHSQPLPEFDKIRQKWDLVLQNLKSISVPAHALLAMAVPACVKDGAIILRFKHRGQANLIANETDKGKEPTKKKALQTAIERVFGVANARILCEATEPEPAAQPAPPPQRKQVSDDDLPDPFQDTGDETLQDVLEVFNGKIVDD